MQHHDWYRFGGFQFDATTGRLFNDGIAQSLPPKAATVLLLLVKEPGRCVTTDYILDRLAPQGQICESNVTQYVAVLRKALCDDARGPSYIATEYGRGYRFIGPVQQRGNSFAPADFALLEARYHLARRHPANLRLALRSFLQIHTKSPNCIDALVGIAEANSTLASHLLVEPSVAFSRAARFAKRALRLSPEAVRAQSVLGHVALFWDQDTQRATQHCADALSQDADDTLALRVMGRISMLQNNWIGARSYLLRELSIRPDSLDAMCMLGVLEQYQRRPEAAANLLQRVGLLDTSFSQSRYYLGNALIDAGCFIDAIGYLLPLGRRDDSQEIVAALGRAYAYAGKRNVARRILNALLNRVKHQYVSPYVVSGLHVALGEPREARNRMTEAKARHDPWAMFFGIEPRFDPIRL